MSPRIQDAPPRTGRSILVLVVIIVVAVGLALLARVRPRSELLDPSSGSPTGGRGLVLVLHSVGATVTTTATVPAFGQHVDRVVVLVDQLSDTQRAGLDAWVDAGGIAIVADPNSPYNGAGQHYSAADAVPDEVDKGVCSIDALSRLTALSFVPLSRLGLATNRAGGTDSGTDDARRFPVAGSGQRHCFGTDQEAFAVVITHGNGLIVSLGENWIFSNQLLASGDNAALATALMAPTDRSTVVILHGTGVKRTTNVVAGGDKTLLQLVPAQVWTGIAGLVAAFVVFSIAAGWRVGRPVTERPLVPIASSDLVVSTGLLMQRAGHTQHAAALMRYQFHRDLCAHYSVDATASLNELDRTVCSRVADPARLAPRALIEVLQATEVSTPTELASLSQQIRTLRNETL